MYTTNSCSISTFSLFILHRRMHAMILHNHTKNEHLNNVPTEHPAESAKHRTIDAVQFTLFVTNFISCRLRPTGGTHTILRLRPCRASAHLRPSPPPAQLLHGTLFKTSMEASNELHFPKLRCNTPLLYWSKKRLKLLQYKRKYAKIRIINQTKESGNDLWKP